MPRPTLLSANDIASPIASRYIIDLMLLLAARSRMITRLLFLLTSIVSVAATVVFVDVASMGYASTPICTLVLFALMYWRTDGRILLTGLSALVAFVDATALLLFLLPQVEKEIPRGDRTYALIFSGCLRVSCSIFETIVARMLKEPTHYVGSKRHISMIDNLTCFLPFSLHLFMLVEMEMGGVAAEEILAAARREHEIVRKLVEK